MDSGRGAEPHEQSTVCTQAPAHGNEVKVDRPSDHLPDHVSFGAMPDRPDKDVEAELAQLKLWATRSRGA